MTDEKKPDEKETRGRPKLCELIVLHGTITYRGKNYAVGETFKVKESEVEPLVSAGVAKINTEE